MLLKEKIKGSTLLIKYDDDGDDDDDSDVILK